MERCFLRLCQPFYLRDVHAFVGSLAPKCRNTCACFHVPDLDTSIITSACNCSAIGTKCHAPDAIAMSVQCLEALSRIALPEPYCHVMTSARKQVSIRMKCNASDPECMPMQCLQTLPCRDPIYRVHIPDAY